MECDVIMDMRMHDPKCAISEIGLWEMDSYTLSPSRSKVRAFPSPRDLKVGLACIGCSYDLEARWQYIALWEVAIPQKPLVHLSRLK